MGNLSSLNLSGKGWVGAQTSAITSSTATDYGQTFTVPASQTISLKVGGSAPAGTISVTAGSYTNASLASHLTTQINADQTFLV